MDTQNSSKRSFAGTFLMAFFLGWLGLHRIYTGKIISGSLILLILLAKVGFSIGLIISGYHLEGSSPSLPLAFAIAHYTIDFAFWGTCLVRFYDVTLIAAHQFSDKWGHTLRPLERATISTHSFFATWILASYLGIFGVHRFYVGKPISGTFMALTLGGLTLWWLVDQILIMMGQFKDADGQFVLKN